MPKKRPLKQAFYLIITIVLTFGLTVSFQSLLAAWIAPASNPPANNVSPPIYQISPSDQSITGGGRLGLGVSPPNETLEIQDTAANTTRLRITDIDSNQNPELQFQYGSNPDDHWAVYVNKNDNSLRFWQTDDRLVILPNGNIGISASPAFDTKLDVNGTIRSKDVFLPGGKNLIIGDDAYFSDIDEKGVLALYDIDGISLGRLRVGAPVDNNDAANKQYVKAVAGGGLFVGFTSAGYDGNLGGIAGANAKCQAEFADSHICTVAELVQSGQTSFAGQGWVYDPNAGQEGNCLNFQDASGNIFSSDYNKFLSSFRSVIEESKVRSLDIAVGPDGHSVICSQQEVGAQYQLVFYRCNNFSCSQSSSKVLKNTGSWDDGPCRIIVGSDNLPAIAYSVYKSPNYYDLVFYKCNDLACNSFSSRVIRNNVNGLDKNLDMVVGPDNQPVIAYRRGGAFGSSWLDVYKCSDSSCSSGNSYDLASGGDNPRIAIGSNNLPRIWHDNRYLYKCNDPACSSGVNTDRGVSNYYEGNLLKGSGDIAILPDNNPVLSLISRGYDNVKKSYYYTLFVLYCVDSSCSHFNTRDIIYKYYAGAVLNNWTRIAADSAGRVLLIGMLDVGGSSAGFGYFYLSDTAKTWRKLNLFVGWQDNLELAIAPTGFPVGAYSSIYRLGIYHLRIEYGLKGKIITPFGLINTYCHKIKSIACCE